jgi:MoxR-like ATPase
MKKQSHNTLAPDAQLESTVTEIVKQVLANGDVEIEIDDSSVKAEVSALRKDTDANLNAMNQRFGRRVDETQARIDSVLGAVKQITDQTNAGFQTLGKSMQAEVQKLAVAVDERVAKALASHEPATSTATFDEAKLKQAADEVFQTLFTAATAKEIATGEKTPLPPLLKVDAFFVQNDQTRRIERCLKTRRHVMASGPSGSGKTFPIEQVLRKHGRRYVKVSVADGMSMSHFLTRPGVRATEKGAETYYTYGFLPFTMKNDLALILDEVDKCQSEIMSVLNAALEYRSVYLPDTGETVTAGHSWQVFMTCNSLRDTTGLYQGFRLDAALMNRVGTFIKADYLTHHEEVAILKRVGLADKDAKIIVGLFNALRKAYEGGKLTAAPSTRIAVRIARALLGQDDEGNQCTDPILLVDAFAECFLDGLPDNEAKEAAAILKNGI